MATTSRSTRPGLVCDTRQHDGKHGHVDGWLAAHGVPFAYRKVDFGDYIRDDDMSNISVDTKKDVQELAGNVGRDHARLVREIERANAAGWRLWFVVEEHPEYNDRRKLATWVSRVCRSCRRCDPLESKCRVRRFKPMNGPTLAKIVARLESDHAARFLFCDRKDTARVICDLLGVRYER